MSTSSATNTMSHVQPFMGQDFAQNRLPYQDRQNKINGHEELLMINVEPYKSIVIDSETFIIFRSTVYDLNDPSKTEQVEYFVSEVPRVNPLEDEQDVIDVQFNVEPTFEQYSILQNM